MVTLLGNVPDISGIFYSILVCFTLMFHTNMPTNAGVIVHVLYHQHSHIWCVCYPKTMLSILDDDTDFLETCIRNE